MIYFIILGILALAWDFYALKRWKHQDKTVSEYIYKFDHHYPIIAVIAGMIIQHYFPAETFMLPFVTGALVGHFTWKA